MRLLSYNIHKGIGVSDRRYRLERIIEVLEHENADLMCLQEVTRDAPRTRHDDQPKLLAEALRAEDSAFQMNVHYKVGGYGNLILSRWPISHRHHISLQHNKRKVRGAQIVVVQTIEGPLHLVNFHLGLSEVERRWQMQHLLKHQLFRESSHLPTILIGDCNDWRNNLHRTILADHGFQHITTPPSHFRSFPAFLSMMALDKAFYHGAISVREARIVRSILTRRASDHLPLVVDFHLA